MIPTLVIEIFFVVESSLSLPSESLKVPESICRLECHALEYCSEPLRSTDILMLKTLEPRISSKFFAPSRLHLWSIFSKSTDRSIHGIDLNRQANIQHIATLRSHHCVCMRSRSVLSASMCVRALVFQFSSQSSPHSSVDFRVIFGFCDLPRKKCDTSDILSCRVCT